jgi:hypothetical protein
MLDVRRDMSAQTQRYIMGGLWTVAIVLCIADVGILSWKPKIPAPSELEQRQIRLAASHQAGLAEARQDIAKGILALKSAGLPAAWSQEFDQILRTRYKVQRSSGLGCVGSEDQFASIDSYNRAMIAEVERLYGKGVIEQAVKDAESAFQKKHEIAEPGSGNAAAPRASALSFEVR